MATRNTPTPAKPAPSASPAAKAARPAPRKASAKAPVKAAAKVPAKAPAKAPARARAKTDGDKPRKPKMVRDSFTMPKPEYAVIEALKQRAAQAGRPAKKSELLRAGLRLLEGLPSAALVAALQALPAIKTGRPTKA